MARGPWHEEVELVVVGASFGGLAAAVMAADLGCRTIVVERSKELGGGAATEAEMIAAAGSRWQRAAGIDDGPERLADDVLAATHRLVEPELAAALAAQGAPLVAWLADRCGAQVELFHEYVAAGHSVARLHGPGERGGAGLSADLARAASRHSHISVRSTTVAERLVRDDPGAVRGVSVRGERRRAGQALAVRARPGRVAYLLFGERMAAAARAADPFFARIVLPRTGRRGATLEDLAKQFELDAEGLRLTIETFSASLTSGGDSFGRARFAGPLEPPFHAIRVTGARWRSLGGLAVDGTARVLDAEGQPIPGLYAAGGAAAGLGGEGTEGFLAGLDTLAALGLARLAALDVIAASTAQEAEPTS